MSPPMVSPIVAMAVVDLWAGGTEQEVEISMYDTHVLESPPSSQDSGPTAYDPLLDFSDDTQFTALAADGMKRNMADIESQIQVRHLLSILNSSTLSLGNEPALERCQD